MIVYLMRHGQAAGGSDAERVLTEAGVEAATVVAARARRGGVNPALILTSTFTRAIQTAEIAARALGCSPPVEQTTRLLPLGSPFDLWDEVLERQPAGDLLIVAHEPLLSAVAALLLDTPALKIRMAPAAMVAIDVERFGAQPNGTLLWMLTPQLA